MRVHMIRRLLAVGALGFFLCGTAFAGQIRIDVSNTGSANAFFPPAASCNLGDHVVWVFIKGGHTVTSGTPCTSSGTFNSGTLINASSAFTWKSTAAGTVPYFCTPHCGAGMVGSLNVATGIDVADFRITEVQFNTAGNLDLIEITNMGTATGDLGRWEAGGRLVIEGRRSDLIISGGENVWPEPVEAVLCRLPKVEDVAVAGTPDPEWGQAVTAFVVPGEDVPTLAELRQAVRQELAPQCAPRRLVLVDAIPRTALGKVRRADLG